MKKEIDVPRIPHTFFKWYCKPHRYEELHGDLEECFHERANKKGLRNAQLFYWFNVIRCCQPYAWKKGIHATNPGLMMFSNYFKVSMRGLMKNPLNSFINVFGLAVAIAICVFAYAYARWTMSTDQFHEHKNEVYLTTFFANRDGVPQQYGTTPRPIGEMMKTDFAQIKKVCRVEDRNVVMKYKDNVFHERVRYTDSDFLEMFSFPLKWGTSKSLADVNSIILSEDMSIKYFGDKNPIGESIQMIIGKDQNKEFKITGVAKSFPKARTISFRFLINFENFHTLEPDYDFHDWTAFVNATFIEVDNPSDMMSIERGMDTYKKLQNKTAKEDWAITSFAFEPLSTLHIRSEDIRDDISRSSKDNYITIMFMVGIALFLLLLACINYINIAIVTATKRLKEIAIRKSIGATRRVVIVQFLSENIVITFFAMIIGLLLGYTFFIPGFERLWNFSMDFKLTDAKLLIYLPAILLITSIASGIYPALYISRFQVVNILKGSVLFGQKNGLTKVFLTIQLVLACVFIVCSVMFAQNTTYLNNRSWGYDQAEALYANVPDQAAFEKLSTLMEQDPDVLSISGSSNHLGKSSTTVVLHFPERDIEVDQLSVDNKYLETMGLQLAEGRVFSDHDGIDKQTIVVNDVLVQNMDWVDPVGQLFKMDSIQYEVIGVLKEFHHDSFSKQIRPIIFKLADKVDYRYLSIKARSGTEIKTYKTLQSKWFTLFPEIPFEGGLQEDVWGSYYDDIKIYDLVWKVFASLVVLLASLGLYGLVRLNVAGRTKEFSIRKVLGAGVKNIAINITNQYVLLFGVALIIGAPLGHIAAKWLIEFSNTYHRPIDFSAVTIGTIILILILFVTISTQVRKVSQANPVEGLTVE